MSEYAVNVETLGVTGQRPKSLGMKDFDPKHPVWAVAYKYVTSSIKNHGASRLISGGALGFDMIAGKAAVDAGIDLVLALPFEGYDAWGQKDKTRLQWLIERAAFVTYICEPGYAPWKYQRRNEYIVDNSEYMLAYWNGNPGGTKNCLDYAKRAGVGWHIKDPMYLPNLEAV